MGNGFLYQVLVKKLPEEMALNWTRWRTNKEERKNVDVFSRWIQEEATLLRKTREELQMTGEKKHPRYNVNNVHNLNKYRNSVYTAVLPYCDTKKPKVPSTSHIYENDYKHRCLSCKGDHFLDQCPKFREKNIEDREKLIRELKLCSNCLKKGHIVKDCKRDKMCRVKECTIKHSYWLHRFVNNKTTVLQDVSRNPEQHTLTVVTNEEKSNGEARRWLSLRTIPVILCNGQRKIEVNALLDDASTISYISTKVKNELGLVGRTNNFPVSVIGGKDQILDATEVFMTLRDVKETLSRNFRALALDNVVGDMKVIEWCKRKNDWHHLKNINFPVAIRRQVVDVLIGADYLEMHQALEEKRGKINEPIARLTPLGWTCVGGPAVGSPYRNQTNFVRTFFANSDSSLDILIKKFWEVEELTEDPESLTTKEKDILKTSINEITQKNGRYEVSIPWKSKRPELTFNREMALSRLKGLEKRFVKDGNLKNDYCKVIEDYKRKEYIKRVNPMDEEKSQWLLPHFPVIKTDRQTTKVRVVFDAAAKNAMGCLNDHIETGPKLQNDLVDIITRFRK